MVKPRPPLSTDDLRPAATAPTAPTQGLHSTGAERSDMGPPALPSRFPGQTGLPRMQQCCGSTRTRHSLSASSHHEPPGTSISAVNSGYILFLQNIESETMMNSEDAD
ncbi:hypothetical protein NDU88_006905 [Pleurodeles waltl]|uniref:Uncharacterized protein n=1 Tax=Pleurodeles waltl TaxID=8319 RepID=A0AAV7N0K2_PLEWA|nr:hypothetical protein NDU88_006905 [Pleurodeles waltl]